MVEYKTTILKFDKQGEKTGWTYIDVPVDIADQLMPNTKKSFRVKGKLDNYKIKQMALIPMGGGHFILPLKADIRKAIGKKHGAQVVVTIVADKEEFKLSEDFMVCLEDEPTAMAYFKTLTGSHQKYFSKWIDSAKTEETKVKRITLAVNALAREMGYPEMIRESQGKKFS
jgi:Domain of unknown function (DUF1905)/Bacteriocin-protection, YdeI or OmpD-Associated